jgi:DNA-binding NtrC family response regulator
LRNALGCKAALCRSETIETDGVLHAFLFRSPPEPRDATPSPASLDELERQHIAAGVLAQSATLQAAAATLGIIVTALWRKRRRYSID